MGNIRMENKIEFGSCVHVAENATLLGRVKIGDNSSIWCGSVLRADLNKITIGNNTNIQDNCTLHVRLEKGLTIGDNCTIEHGSIINAATIGNNVFIGAGSIVLDGAIVQDNVYICAGSLIPPKRVVETNSRAIGNPFKIKDKLLKEEIEYILEHADLMSELSKTYLCSIDNINLVSK